SDNLKDCQLSLNDGDISMATITIHSFKGGTGKSLIAAALGYHMSEQGRKVLLIDGDYYAPCFDTFFPQKKDGQPFTSFLAGKAAFKDVVHPSQYKNLYVSYAPTPDFSQEILQADAKTHGRYLKQILAGIKTAKNDMEFDEIIIDNSSGISLAAINFLSCSTRSVLVIRPVRYGVETTFNIINAIYRKLKYSGSGSVRKDFLVWNQVPIQEGSVLEPRIKKYLDYWTDKFAAADIAPGPTIPYIFDIVASMIAESTMDLPKLTEFLEEHIKTLSALVTT
ncbi:MAG: AAA family ATPase, partial [Candidatus Thorarchaeota archaeon]|nr:AAA family ATPase [Candidatus Thorarchaeota archaeon]